MAAEEARKMRILRAIISVRSWLKWHCGRRWARLISGEKRESESVSALAFNSSFLGDRVALLFLLLLCPRQPTFLPHSKPASRPAGADSLSLSITLSLCELRQVAWRTPVHRVRGGEKIINATKYFRPTVER